jgi:hypothetical protein
MASAGSQHTSTFDKTGHCFMFGIKDRNFDFVILKTQSDENMHYLT